MWDKAKPFVIPLVVVVALVKLGYVQAGANKFPLIG
jgi:hypothetical protein